MQGGITRFFYTTTYRAANALNVYVSRRFSEALGIQYSSTKKVNNSTTASEYSPRVRAEKVKERIKEQLMVICNGDVAEYNQMNKSDVELFIIKFETFIKQTNRGS